MNLATFASYYSSSYDYQTSSNVATGFGLAFGVGVIVFMLIFGALMYVLYAWLLSRVFHKMGIEQWKAWVPVYNTWTLLEAGGQHGWLALLSIAAIIPFVGWIGAVVTAVYVLIAMYRIGLAFGKETWFIVLGIFLPIVWFAWIGFDDSKWEPARAGLQPVHGGPAPQADTTAPKQ